MLGMNNDGLEYFPPDKTRDNLDIDLKRKYIKDFETTVKMALISNLYFDEIMELVNMSNNHFSFKSMIAVLKDIPVDMVIKKILDSID